MAQVQLMRQAEAGGYSVTMSKGMERACNEIDAAVFSGDEFFDPEAADRLVWFMTRWVKGLKELREVQRKVDAEEAGEDE